jgi:ubiquinone/menaquinone biosynthesis C-methylase UbiE
MSLMTGAEFDAFFEPYAGNVEGFYEAAYWKLSDELIKELVRRHLGVTAGSQVLDAGGGTGRWARWLAEEFDTAVTIADKSPRMLAEAERNVAHLGERVTRVECDLEDATQLPDRHFDAVLSTYGVLSFFDDPAAAFRTLYRVLKPGAYGLLMSHSLTNALHSKIHRDGAGPEELQSILDTGVVKWAPHVPQLRVFRAADLRRLATDAGFEAPAVFGVTCLTWPGPEDFGYPYDALSSISTALEGEAYFASALRLELVASEHAEWAERGVNLMIKVRRPA